MNTDGGKFVCSIPKKLSTTGLTDERWMFTVLTVVGKMLDLDGDHVEGAVMSMHNLQDRIVLWLKSSDKLICHNIGLQQKKALDTHKVNLKYQILRDVTCMHVLY